ncbi:hypothetical protein DIPPA_31154 [Diplonema papillatum]|nr:hypothetical protein DIPPA_31154 [Diplonema papillatum]
MGPPRPARDAEDFRLAMQLYEKNRPPPGGGGGVSRAGCFAPGVRRPDSPKSPGRRRGRPSKKPAPVDGEDLRGVWAALAAEDGARGSDAFCRDLYKIALCDPSLMADCEEADTSLLDGAGYYHTVSESAEGALNNLVARESIVQRELSAVSPEPTPSASDSEDSAAFIGALLAGHGEDAAAPAEAAPKKVAARRDNQGRPREDPDLAYAIDRYAPLCSADAETLGGESDDNLRGPAAPGLLSEVFRSQAARDASCGYNELLNALRSVGRKVRRDKRERERLARLEEYLPSAAAAAAAPPPGGYSDIGAAAPVLARPGGLQGPTERASYRRLAGGNPPALGSAGALPYGQVALEVTPASPGARGLGQAAVAVPVGGGDDASAGDVIAKAAQLSGFDETRVQALLRDVVGTLSFEEAGRVVGAAGLAAGGGLPSPARRRLAQVTLRLAQRARLPKDHVARLLTFVTTRATARDLVDEVFPRPSHATNAEPLPPAGFGTSSSPLPLDNVDPVAQRLLSPPVGSKKSKSARSLKASGSTVGRKQRAPGAASNKKEKPPAKPKAGRKAKSAPPRNRAKPPGQPDGSNDRDDDIAMASTTGTDDESATEFARSVASSGSPRQGVKPPSSSKVKKKKKKKTSKKRTAPSRGNKRKPKLKATRSMRRPGGVDHDATPFTSDDDGPDIAIRSPASSGIQHAKRNGENPDEPPTAEGTSSAAAEKMATAKPRMGKEAGLNEASEGASDHASARSDSEPFSASEGDNEGTGEGADATKTGEKLPADTRTDEAPALAEKDPTTTPERRHEGEGTRSEKPASQPDNCDTDPSSTTGGENEDICEDAKEGPRSAPPGEEKGRDHLPGAASTALTTAEEDGESAQGGWAGVDASHNAQLAEECPSSAPDAHSNGSARSVSENTATEPSETRSRDEERPTQPTPPSVPRRPSVSHAAPTTTGFQRVGSVSTPGATKVTQAAPLARRKDRPKRASAQPAPPAASFRKQKTAKPRKVSRPPCSSRRPSPAGSRARSAASAASETPGLDATGDPWMPSTPKPEGLHVLPMDANANRQATGDSSTSSNSSPAGRARNRRAASGVGHKRLSAYHPPALLARAHSHRQLPASAAAARRKQSSPVVHLAIPPRTAAQPPEWPPPHSLVPIFAPPPPGSAPGSPAVPNLHGSHPAPQPPPRGGLTESFAPAPPPASAGQGCRPARFSSLRPPSVETCSVPPAGSSPDLARHAGGHAGGFRQKSRSVAAQCDRCSRLEASNAEIAAALQHRVNENAAMQSTLSRLLAAGG